jgi:hypothetical protein
VSSGQSDVPGCKRHAIEFRMAARGRPGSQMDAQLKAVVVMLPRARLPVANDDAFDGRNLNGSP